MKPPSRRRAVPHRFVAKQQESGRLVQDRGEWCGWSRSERRLLLALLKKQSDQKDIDISALKAKIAKRSSSEIKSVLQFLKSRVGKVVAQHVKRLWREEHLARVPIQLWESLSRDMAGSLEEAISSAFSQTVVIGATEPCSLLHSVPSRYLSLPEKHKTIRLKPTIRSCTSDGAECSRCSPGLETQLQVTTAASVSGTRGTVCPLPSGPNSPNPSCQLPKSSQASTPVSTPAATALVPSPHLASSTQAGVKQCSAGQPQPPPFRSTLGKQEYTVNFEKLYRYLNSVNKKTKEAPLTAMESAVVLDLLMSLPEETSMLDCQELQHHLCQVHNRLTSTAEEPRPCGRPSASEPDDSRTFSHYDGEDVGPSSSSHLIDRGGLSEQEGTGQPESSQRVDNGVSSTQSKPFTAPEAKARHAVGSGTSVTDGTVKAELRAQPDTRGEKADWATAGLCPLNPFMIPLKLLARVKAPGVQDEP